eukprot:TRINITY_DN4957_c0_g1::TRINITY_DN4957_c0_g1_i1::g.16701::m.16701 TRINITY_DN4957_c0_g1::TRINITY_DN4957_c0_g1_i1::g.16701  ORF type:complete len:294 (-),score=33.10,PMP22_Claudin/PF00822.15/5.5e-06,Claudin_2/PF13903.1/3.4e-05,7tm_3/PF00003.17/0.0069,MARVEL/PF01284.18/0.024,zf-LSD1/PF06943.7/0.27,DUF2207/PF09972.4/0.29,SUR7/PF06687.7/0.22,Amastin/PF07344.6/49,Amastin/PF07344.6/3.1 TRINITY_DN4957_c0_g1_i1:408-1250(-)
MDAQPKTDPWRGPKKLISGLGVISCIIVIAGISSPSVPWLYESMGTYTAQFGLKELELCIDDDCETKQITEYEDLDPQIEALREAGDVAFGLVLVGLILGFLNSIVFFVLTARGYTTTRKYTFIAMLPFVVSALFYALACVSYVGKVEDEDVCDDTKDECYLSTGYMLTWAGAILEFTACGILAWIAWHPTSVEGGYQPLPAAYTPPANNLFAPPQHPNSSTYVPPANNNSGYGQPEPAAPAVVQCFRCHTYLHVPPNAPLFACPCGNLLQAPGPAVPHA